MPARCTGTSAWNATACWSAGRCRRACRSTRRPTTWQSRPKTTPCPTPRSRARFQKANTAAERSRSGTRGPTSCRPGPTARSKSSCTASGSTAATSSSAPAARTGWCTGWTGPRRAGSHCRAALHPCWPAPGPSRGGRAGPSSSSGTGCARWATSKAAGCGCCPATTATSPPPIRSCAAPRSRLGSTQVVLDGEIVALDPATGRPDFGRLQRRMHVDRPGQAARLARQVPTQWFVFDVLHLDGRSLLDDPYATRREVLESLDLPFPVPPSLREDGATVLQASRAQGLEGVVAKRLRSPYRPGQRSDDWVKVKVVHRQEVVIGGWEPGEDGRAGSIGALLLGTYDDAGELRYAGQVGTGFTQQTLGGTGAPARPAAPGEQPLRRRGAPVGGPTCRVGRTRARRRSRVRLLDSRRQAAPSLLQGAARRLRPARGPAGAIPAGTVRRCR